MNKRDWIILSVLDNFSRGNQRQIMQKSGLSIGFVNASLKKLADKGYIDSELCLTEKAQEHKKAFKPQRAVILAAGMGSRMVPLNRTPKGLLSVNGEPLIERVIKQLHERNIHEIYIVVGYMMERFEYLTDKYDVELIYDRNYYRRDSMNSLSLVADKLENCYIVPSSIWFARNPFNEHEYYSWYAIAEYTDQESFVRLNRKYELVYTQDEMDGNEMLGLSYVSGETSAELRERLLQMNESKRNYRQTWEKALLKDGKMMVYARIMMGQTAYAVNTYENLRDLDSESRDLASKRINLICSVFNIEGQEITDIVPVKKGMTNHLMQFSVHDVRYMLREPGEGSNELTDRRREAEVYMALDGLDITEKVKYISPDDGYKIAEYIDDCHECDPNNDEDVRRSIIHLRKLHDAKLTVGHSFDLMEMLLKYEELRNGSSSFSDYDVVRERIVGLMALLEELSGEKDLCHIDSVSDNFLLTDSGVTLIDWEYAGMSEYHIDIAMFCLYADYSREKMDWVIDLYFDGKATDLDRFKIYAYAACGGLLWSVWCDYKASKGIDYAEYQMKQYRYGKRFYKYAMELYEAAGLGKSE